MLGTAVGITAAEPQLISHLEIIDIETGVRREVLETKQHIEAPNWSRDGSILLVNGNGLIYTVPVAGGELTLLDTGSANRCNNDHGYSPDGKWLAISHSTNRMSQIFILPAEGGKPRQVTFAGPSYWHGWSPDGKRLAYCARRDNAYDIHTIEVEGGKETRLTHDAGHNDGPDYSADGKFIYFNSNRSGVTKIWRMNVDGSEQVQYSPDDEYADWFAHPSPDGKWVVFLSYDKSVKGHPGNKDVALRIMPAAGGDPKILAKLHGGQGTINVPSWSPDSRKVAFVSYSFE
jgi:Tol biopolymer transport system component